MLPVRRARPGGVSGEAYGPMSYPDVPGSASCTIFAMTIASLNNDSANV